MATSNAGDESHGARHLQETEVEVERATESTSLLGSSSTEGAKVLEGEDSWDGLDDFKGEPWWRVPSVRAWRLQLSAMPLTRT
jgi:hypothetical protein